MVVLTFSIYGNGNVNINRSLKGKQLRIYNRAVSVENPLDVINLSSTDGVSLTNILFKVMQRHRRVIDA